MRGFFYRMAIRIKDFGERLHVNAIIRLGLWIKGVVIDE
jgi:hypothetical protein